MEQRDRYAHIPLQSAHHNIRMHLCTDRRVPEADPSPRRLLPGQPHVTRPLCVVNPSNGHCNMEQVCVLAHAIRCEVIDSFCNDCLSVARH